MLAACLALLLAPARAAENEAGLRDPLRPPGTVETEATDTFDASAWRLVSTLIADGRRVAIINDRSVRPGDRIGGAKVMAIEPGRARLEYQGRRFTISGPGNPVNKGEQQQ